MLGKRLLQSLPKTSTLTHNPQIKQLKTAHARSIDMKKLRGHVNLAAAKQWRFTTKWKDGSTLELIIFRVQDFLSAQLPC